MCMCYLLKYLQVKSSEYVNLKNKGLRFDKFVNVQITNTKTVSSLVNILAKIKKNLEMYCWRE